MHNFEGKIEMHWPIVEDEIDLLEIKLGLWHGKAMR